MFKNDDEKTTEKKIAGGAPERFSAKRSQGTGGDGGMRNATERSSPVGTRWKSRTGSISRQHPGGLRRI